MGYVTSLTILGKSRADGTTGRSVTYQRVANVSDGFTLRETGAASALAATITYRANESKTALNLPIRHSGVQIEWPYEKVPGDGVVAGRVSFNKNGLHVPVDCPQNARIDIKAQMAAYFNDTVAGTVGGELHNFPMITGVMPF